MLSELLLGASLSKARCVQEKILTGGRTYHFNLISFATASSNTTSDRNVHSSSNHNLNLAVNFDL